MYKRLILLRHGQSVWNLENRFTGWHDVELTKQGICEAIHAGKVLKYKNILPTVVFTSVQKRALKTCYLTLDQINRLWIPHYKSYKLNERHYGALTGLNKEETANKYGEELVKNWRRSYKLTPPLLNKDSKYYPGNDIRYTGINNLPLGESLETTYNRVIPYWKNEIINKLKHNDVLVVAHGNSIRSLIKYLEDISDKSIEHLSIPTGEPIIYNFDDNMKIKNYHLDQNS
jgi:2,3-bisphosphoglycerate-dependent phosphoglycerate mutase